MNGNATLVIREWPHKELTCLLPAATCTSTALIAILGVFSITSMPWNRRLVLAMLLHPMNALQGYVVMYFSMVNLSDFVDRPNCPKLIRITVISFLGVSISTLAISLFRSSQLLLAKTKWAWSPRTEMLWDSSSGVSVSAALVFLFAVHTFTLISAHIALSNGFWEPLKPICVEFFTSTEATIPYIALSICFIGTSLLLLVLSVILLTYGEKRRSQLTATVVQIEDNSQEFTFIPPPEDGGPRAENFAMAVPENRRVLGHSLQGGQYLDNRNQHIAQERSFNNENNHRFNRRPEDFYDYERRRHRVQSPPPIELFQLRQTHQVETQLPMNQLGQVEQTNRTQAPTPPPANVQPTTDVDEISNNESSVRQYRISSSLLERIFPHRTTIANKNRFSYTKVQHRRHLYWSVRNYHHPCVVSTNEKAFTDYAICISNLLYVVSYSFLACFLIYSSKDMPNPVLDRSLQPFVIMCMVKGTLESILYVTLMRFTSLLKRFRRR